MFLIPCRCHDLNWPPIKRSIPTYYILKVELGFHDVC
ncbi:hypothetical protein SLEP1_g9059 [Rubroshorea leprosula]|uniref:Uncharacterized protein n=1 Tax=Rubroshorea leprosula TaxID=152421 RepID=A0AAV5IDK5_9ROSI|nr:hypothetical protein SLEP1_g9059 [Rubroshorea leprosula]